MTMSSRPRDNRRFTITWREETNQHNINFRINRDFSLGCITLECYLLLIALSSELQYLLHVPWFDV